MAFQVTKTRVAGALTLGILLWIGGRAVLRAMESDQDKIRRLCQEMVDAFNEQRTSRFMAGLDENFLDVQSGVRREELREALVYTFFQEIDQQSKKFALRADLPEVPFDVVVTEGEPKTAKASISANISRLQGDKPQAWWDARISGELAKTEKGWQWTRTTSVNHSDRKRKGR